MLDNTPNVPSEFRIRNWVEINRKLRGVYDANNDIKFKTTMIRSSLCDYSDAYIHAKGTITIPNMAAAGVAANIDYGKILF